MKRSTATIIKENTREDVTSKISTICENDLEGDPKREQLGIFASPRAAMYFGSWHNVDIDEIPSLEKKGTDVVFMEKRGVLEIVKYIGDIYGIAFVNTQGHFAEYPKDLIRQIIKNGGNVGIKTDFDCAGIHIAEKVISDVIGEEHIEYEEAVFDMQYEETPVFEVRPPYDIADSVLVPQQKPRYPEYYGRVVRLVLS